MAGGQARQARALIRIPTRFTWCTDCASQENWEEVWNAALQQEKTG